ncbi:MAG: TRAP transporter small permease [Betaproteobacteria bacterium]|nr:MAG: TRAP transporter small permease [Betaproteobacteria bacterium]
MLWLSANVRRLAVGLVLLGSVGMMASMIICVADVVGTNFLDWPVPGALEITESTMVLIVFGALAYTQERRGHIRVEILHGHMGPRVRSFMDLVTHFLALVFFALLAWQSFGELSYGWEIRESTMGTIRFPLYPARFLLSAGAVLLVAQLALDVIVDFGRMRRGEGPPPHAAAAD